MLPVVGYNRYPDEKGTESLQCLSIEMTAPAGYNRYPDEKGTERGDFERYRGNEWSYNRYPDEKGTESLNSSMSRSSSGKV